jgi:hypothetical protein
MGVQDSGFKLCSKYPASHACQAARGAHPLVQLQVLPLLLATLLLLKLHLPKAWLSAQLVLAPNEQPAGGLRET